MYSKSPNYRILREILSKMRRIDYSKEISYLIIYTFLYKYASYHLKSYLLQCIEKRAITLDEAFRDEREKEDLRLESLNMFGFFINDPDYFMDEVMNTSYSDRFFVHKFVEAFCQHVEFLEGSNHEKYFNFIFDAVKSGINFNKFEFEGENHLIVKDIIYSISKLDVSAQDYTYEFVFDRICQSRLLRLDQDPEYINQLMAAIVNSAKPGYVDIYNPFLNDGSALIYYMMLHLRIKTTCGRGFDKITHCACITKLFMYNFHLENVFLEFSSPFDAINADSSTYDVIMSKIPAMTSRNLRRLNRNQNVEFVKRNKRKQLENLLADSFDLSKDSFMSDDELSSSLDTLLDRMDLEKYHQLEFSGEYESLKNSEYLFLLNLIDSLKDDGIMVLTMSQSFLFKNSLETLRKYLTVEKNYIDAIISIPDELSRTKNSEIVVVFRKNKSCEDILFMDLSKNYVTEPSPLAVPGLFRKNLILSNETLNNIVKVYDQRRTVDKFSNVVGLNQLVKNEFNLSVSRYVDTFEGEFISLSQLKDDRKEIDVNLRKLNKKIDLMMDDLGIRF